MTAVVKVISSMATRQILAALAGDVAAAGIDMQVESVGGIEAAKRARGREPFDVVVLAADALQALAAEGHVIGDSVHTFAHSPTALAVRKGVAHAARCDEAAIRRLVIAADRIALSTGPSGVSIRRMLETWHTPDLERRCVQAKPGVPVAHLLASGQADIGFQQLSELLGEPGIDIVGVMPADLQPMTVFACGIGSKTTNAKTATDVIRILTSDAAAANKHRHGMEP